MNYMTFVTGAARAKALAMQLENVGYSAIAKR